MNLVPALVLATATALACAAAAPAFAQQYRCVDASGKVSYADRGGPGCTARGAPAGPAAASAPSAKAAAGATKAPRDVLDAATAQKKGVKPAVAAAQPPETQAQQAGRCAGVKQEYEWLKGPKGEGVPGRDARLAQMQKALASCP